MTGMKKKNNDQLPATLTDAIVVSHQIEEEADGLRCLVFPTVNKDKLLVGRHSKQRVVAGTEDIHTTHKSNEQMTA